MRIHNCLNHLEPSILAARCAVIAGLITIIMEIRSQFADAVNGYILGASLILLGTASIERLDRKIKLSIRQIAQDMVQYQSAALQELLARKKG